MRSTRLPTDTMSDDTSSASESSGEYEVVQQRVTEPKKRKATYYQRKDEIQILQDQVKQLQEQLKGIHQGGASATGSPSLGPSQQSVPVPVRYGLAIERNNLRLAGAQSMISAFNLSQSEGSTPLKALIHLPVNPAERSKILQGMREQRLDIATRFMVERTRFLDLGMRHRQFESFELPNGDFVMSGLTVHIFDRGHTLRQVFDEFMFFMCHQEMSISEKLGILTIRESEEMDGYLLSRFLSTLPEGVEIEMNAAMFARCVDTTDDTPGFALGTINCVDQDDLYPYRPDTCGRIDMNGVIMLTEVATPSGPAIAMSSWSYTRFVSPTFPVPEAAEAGIKRLLGWCDLIPKSITERFAMHSRGVSPIVEIRVNSA